MRNKIVGWIGIIWGSAILVSMFVRKAPMGNGPGPYAAGAMIGFLLGAAMLAAGIYVVRKRP